MRLSARTVTLPLAETFVISRETQDDVELTQVELVHDGVTGFGEAATAANIAKTRIDPHAKVFPGHSSEMTSQADSVVTL